MDKETTRLGGDTRLQKAASEPLDSVRVAGPVEAKTVAATAPASSSPVHLKWNYLISARPLLVSRTSSPMTVMLSSRPTIRLVLPGIAPPAR